MRGKHIGSTLSSDQNAQNDIFASWGYPGFISSGCRSGWANPHSYRLRAGPLYHLNGSVPKGYLIAPSKTNITQICFSKQ